ncbi:unnamed protein product [Rotaria sp. Silwood1]|nr:unnamed protein product [Rotaria sp. Silwood1]CAF1285929.1 unnamed protein product [Rotaria sp. Silwood1]CAF3463930.1 unnamed protein product [Rotaria sp. Silwood1]CAF3538387.1 unnamed protein product [Rotaria sp. Silwood1]CAF3562946.1 unnamed protein product [Rotaria sp. Silwood1]
MSTNTTDQLVLFKRLFIIFGSICFLWLIIGFIFLSIQTYRHLKRKTYLKYLYYNYASKLPSSLLLPIENAFKEDHMIDCDQIDDEQTSIYTTASFDTEQSKIVHEQTNFIPSCQRISTEQYELTLSNTAAISNLSYNQSILTSSSNLSTSLFYYQSCQKFSYSQSTLSSLKTNIHQKIRRPSLIIPLNNSSSSIDQFNLKRQLSQTSTNTNLSQITNTTYLSSQSSIKTIPLPTVMITDVDRLHTDIIELENFEPENDFYHINSQLRYLLNDRIPHDIK